MHDDLFVFSTAEGHDELMMHCTWIVVDFFLFRPRFRKCVKSIFNLLFIL